MVGRAAELGLAAIGIADCNSLAGVVRARRRQGEHRVAAAWSVRGSSHRTASRPSAIPRIARPGPPMPPADCRQSPHRQRPVSFQLRGGGGASEGQIFIVLPPRRIGPIFTERLRRSPPLREAARISPRCLPIDGTERRGLGRDQRACRYIPRAARCQQRRALSPSRPPAARRTCSPASASNARSSTRGYRLQANAERHHQAPEEMARLLRDRRRRLPRVEIADAARSRSTSCATNIPRARRRQGNAAEHLTQLTWRRRPPALSRTACRTRCAQSSSTSSQLIAELDYAPYFPHRVRHGALRPQRRASCARAAARRPTPPSATAWASPPSIPIGSICCSSASSRASATSRPTSTSTSSTSGAKRSSSTSTPNTAATAPP